VKHRADVSRCKGQWCRKKELTSAPRDAKLRLDFLGYCYMGNAYGKRVQFPRGRATVIGDESQQDEPLAGIPLGRRWRVG
jgi:hypothetical protein